MDAVCSAPFNIDAKSSSGNASNGRRCGSRRDGASLHQQGTLPGTAGRCHVHCSTNGKKEQEEDRRDGLRGERTSPPDTPLLITLPITVSWQSSRFSLQATTPFGLANKDCLAEAGRQAGSSAASVAVLPSPASCSRPNTKLGLSIAFGAHR